MTELEEDEDLASLMAEPPHGVNAGWSRSESGWSSLETPRRHHAKQFHQPWSDAAVKHGTPGGYTTHGCRCDACRAWKRDYNRLRRVRKPVG